MRRDPIGFWVPLISILLVLIPAGACEYRKYCREQEEFQRVVEEWVEYTKGLPSFFASTQEQDSFLLRQGELLKRGAEIEPVPPPPAVVAEGHLRFISVWEPFETQLERLLLKEGWTAKSIAIYELQPRIRKSYGLFGGSAYAYAEVRAYIVAFDQTQD